MSAKHLLAVFCAVLLTGCAATRYKPVSHDSRKPALAAPGCLEARLEAGGQCLALVRADQWWSDTGVAIQAGAAYRITVPRGQAWFDKDRANEAPMGEHGSALMNFYAAYKRHEESDWFSLVAAVAGPGTRTEREELQWVDIGAVAGANCRSVVFRAKRGGALTLYPNDAKGPETHPTYFYENNSGQVWVLVRRLPDSAAPAPGADPVAEDCGNPERMRAG